MRSQQNFCYMDDVFTIRPKTNVPAPPRSRAKPHRGRALSLPLLLTQSVKIRLVIFLAWHNQRDRSIHGAAPNFHPGNEQECPHTSSPPLSPSRPPSLSPKSASTKNIIACPPRPRHPLLVCVRAPRATPWTRSSGHVIDSSAGRLADPRSGVVRRASSPSKHTATTTTTNRSQLLQAKGGSVLLLAS